MMAILLSSLEPPDRDRDDAGVEPARWWDYALLFAFGVAWWLMVLWWASEPSFSARSMGPVSAATDSRSSARCCETR